MNDATVEKTLMSGEDSMDEPTITERVRFWQEQDRINRELIPRVIKNHETDGKRCPRRFGGILGAQGLVWMLYGQLLGKTPTG